MAEEELQVLQRAVQAGGGVPERLRLARALGRAGRTDEVPALLAPARDHPEVRRELLGWPAWGQEHGGGGGTRWLDLPPIERAPRVRWASELADAQKGPLLATPLGIALAAGGLGEQATAVLDPETGASVARINGAPLLIAGGALLVAIGPIIAAHDLVTGERLHRTTLPTMPWEAWHADGRLAVLLADGQLLVHDWPEPTEAPPRLSWAQPIRTASRYHVGWVGRTPLAIGADLIAVGDETSGIVFDAASGERRWSFGGGPTVIDERGLLTADERARWTWLDRDGNPRWACGRQMPGLAAVVGPDAVVGAIDRIEPDPRRGFDDPPGPALVIDRASGEVRCPIPPDRIALAVGARDVVYADEGDEPVPFGVRPVEPPPEREADALWASRIDGTLLWRFEKREVGTVINALAPMARRLVGLTADGTVFCLEEQPEGEP